MPGPIPKRSDQRRRENKPEINIEKGVAGAVGVEIPDPNPAWLPPTLRWYESLAESGQSHWYEPSDWAQAWILAELLDRELLKDKASSMMIAAWMTGASELMTTEGSRRRLRIELAKGSQIDEDHESAVADLLSFRQSKSS